MNQLPINIWRRGPVTYYSINFQQHKSFYNFYAEEIVDSFFNSIKERIVPSKNDEFKMQGYAEIIHFQPTEIVELENIRLCVTKVYFW